MENPREAVQEASVNDEVPYPLAPLALFYHFMHKGWVLSVVDEI